MKRSWVWNYADKKGDKAVCNLCDGDTELSCAGGSTGSMARHIQNSHKIKPPMATSSNMSDTPETSESTDTEEIRQTATMRRARKRQYDKIEDRLCGPTRTEEIHMALAKMIAINQQPLSFCSSEGLQQFMAVVEPNYKICKEAAIKTRLHALQDEVALLIKTEMASLPSVACTSDCWSSRGQDSYLTITAHGINNRWEPVSYTLNTLEMEDRHTATNIAMCIDRIINTWDLQEKVVAVVTDNAANMLRSLKLLTHAPEFVDDSTCAAHSIQLAVNKALTCHDDIQIILEKCSKLVTYFKHSTIATNALRDKQSQLGMSQLTLLQSCSTRWNSTYFMLHRLTTNRIAIINVLADRAIFTPANAQKFSFSEMEWNLIDALVVLLKPLEVITTVLCYEGKSPISMVRPLVTEVLKNHYQYTQDDTEMAATCKTTIRNELNSRFHLGALSNQQELSIRQISSFFDPRYKDLEHETMDIRSKIRDYVKQNLCSQNTHEEEREDTTASALQFIYSRNTHSKEPVTQFDTYLSEVQLRFDLDPFEWWRARGQKYPILSAHARKFLAVPATSTSSERIFSTAGNIVSAKRSCLLPENVDMLVFLYQNRARFQTNENQKL